MPKRDVLRYLPGFNRLATTLDRYEEQIARLTAEADHLRAENIRLCSESASLTAERERLREYLHQLAFGDTGTDTDGASGGHPLPSAVLRYLVAGTADATWFLRGGELGADTVRGFVSRQGRTLDELGPVLDFGCGCGRVLRHLTDTPGVELHGSDCNPHAIRWCRTHLPVARYEVNGLAPPLPHPDAHFGLVYAFSVFTHLTADLQAAWMAELRRVVAPGGYLLLTVHGDACLSSLPPDDLAAYRRGEMVARVRELVGGNECAAFHPESQVRAELAAGWEVAEFVPSGALGNPPQDAYLLRKPK